MRHSSSMSNGYLNLSDDNPVFIILPFTEEVKWLG